MPRFTRPRFTPGLPAAAVHSHLTSALHTMEQAQQSAILWFGDLNERKLFRELGYATIGQYAEQELGWGKSKTYDFLNISRKLEKVPKVKTKVASGELGYTHAREVLKVTDETNQEQWLDVALKKTRRELVHEVKRARSEAAEAKVGQATLLPVADQRPIAVVPSRVSLEMSPTQVARYEALWEKIRKLGGVPADKVEALLTVMDAFVSENSTRVENVEGPAVQIHLHQCPECEKATVQTSRGELEINQAGAKKAQCDARVSQSGQRNTTTIPPRRRREVLARDRHRCQRPGCGNTHFLEVHHKIPRAKGGTNEADNLVTLCSGCHQLVHEKPGWVKSPRESYRFRSGPISARSARSRTG